MKETLAEIMEAHVAEGERRQQELIRRMTPRRRLEIAGDLYRTAWEFKSAWLRSRHPEWGAAEVAAATRRIFLTGYAGD